MDIRFQRRFGLALPSIIESDIERSLQSGMIHFTPSSVTVGWSCPCDLMRNTLYQSQRVFLLYWLVLQMRTIGGIAKFPRRFNHLKENCALIGKTNPELFADIQPLCQHVFEQLLLDIKPVESFAGIRIGLPGLS